MEGASIAAPAATQTADPVEKIPGKLVQAGKPEPGVFKPAAQAPAEGDGKTDLPPEGKTDPPKPDDLPDLSDDQLKTLLAKKGIDIGETGFEGLKEKIKPAAPAPAPAEPTEEQKAAKDAAFEKRMLDYFIANGGTPEQFVSVKQIASADLKELSQAQIEREMTEAGFTKDEIGIVLKERYYQINPDELEIGENETEEEFSKRKALTEKKIAYGAKKLENKSSYIKNQAVSSLKDLRDAIETEDLLKAKEAEISSKVDDTAKTLPRKMTIELGKVEDQEITPIDIVVSEDDIAEVVGTLKDPVKRNQFLYNQDNSLNLENLAKVLLRNKMLESAVKASYTEGGTRMTQVFENTFPGRSASDVGVGGVKGGSQTGRKGVLVSAGKPEVGVRNTK